VQTSYHGSADLIIPVLRTRARKRFGVKKVRQPLIKSQEYSNSSWQNTTLIIQRVLEKGPTPSSSTVRRGGQVLQFDPKNLRAGKASTINSRVQVAINATPCSVLISVPHPCDRLRPRNSTERWGSTALTSPPESQSSKTCPKRGQEAHRQHGGAVSYRPRFLQPEKKAVWTPKPRKRGNTTKEQCTLQAFPPKTYRGPCRKAFCKQRARD